MFDRGQVFIDGRWTAAASKTTIELVSPATEQVIARVPDGNAQDMARAAAAARKAFDDGRWSGVAPRRRADVLDRIAVSMEAHHEALAAAITAEMGSPISLSQQVQVPVAIGHYRFAADALAEAALESTCSDGSTLVVRQPVGVIAAIVPWNVPMIVTAQKLAPALAAGCTVVLKPAPEAPLSAALLADIVAEAGLPPGVLNIVVARAQGAEALVTHPDVDKVSFTGSVEVGRRVMGLCAPNGRRISLELGGKSAAIVLDDVELSAAIPGLVKWSMMNSGQACLAHSRLLAPRSRYDEVVDAMAEAIAGLVIGPPDDPRTQIGPLVRKTQRDRVEHYIASGRSQGASVVVGGGRPDGLPRGWFVEPTLLRDVSNWMTVAREEIFGPVLVAIPYDDDDAAIAIANDSPYGLSASVWSNDRARARGVARRLRVGQVIINDAPMPVDAPFGGFKASGFGRECGLEGLAGYLESTAISDGTAPA